jgi:hypothetical protein
MYDNDEEQGPKLSTRKAHQISIELALRYFFPWLEPLPPRLHTANWLSVCGNNINLVLDTIEKVAAQDVDDPERVIWSRLRKFDVRHSNAFAALRQVA